jgi:peroxiredoxin
MDLQRLEAGMNRLQIGDSAPDFALPDYKGNLVRLSDIYMRHNVLLVFNIGFA